MLQQLDVMYLTGQALADSNQWPEWKTGSPFQKRKGSHN
jgi:hypothetical protein